MKYLKRMLNGIIRYLFDSAKNSKPKKSAATPNVFIKELPDGVDTSRSPYRHVGAHGPRRADGSSFPRFSVVCSFKGGSSHTFNVWCDDSATANWAVFFTIEELVPRKGHLLETIDVKLAEGAVPDGSAASGSFRTLEDAAPLPEEFYH